MSQATMSSLSSSILSNWFLSSRSRFFTTNSSTGIPSRKPPVSDEPLLSLSLESAIFLGRNAERPSPVGTNDHATPQQTAKQSHIHGHTDSTFCLFDEVPLESRPFAENHWHHTRTCRNVEAIFRLSSSYWLGFGISNGPTFKTVGQHLVSACKIPCGNLRPSKCIAFSQLWVPT